MQSLKELLIQYRKNEGGMTQAQIAGSLRVSTKTLGEIIKGKADQDVKNWSQLGQRKRTPLVGSIARLCLALSVDPREWFRSRKIVLTSGEEARIDAQTQKLATEANKARVDDILDEIVTAEDAGRLTRTQEAMGSALTIREVTRILLAWHAERKEEHGSPD